MTFSHGQEDKIFTLKLHVTPLVHLHAGSRDARIDISTLLWVLIFLKSLVVIKRKFLSIFGYIFVWCAFICDQNFTIIFAGSLNVILNAV